LFSSYVYGSRLTKNIKVARNKYFGLAAQIFGQTKKRVVGYSPPLRHVWLNMKHGYL